MRGEDVLGGLPHPLPKETPPHAWGRPVRHVEYAGQPGNTPTCVGKTTACWGALRTRRKHPHMRGEDYAAQVERIVSVETPPHAWGRLPGTGRREAEQGNTPTCVGKTQCSEGDGRHVGKHPHMRGEDLMRCTVTASFSETPPHAWGRRSFRRAGHLAERNTPTCVGKTGLAWRRGCGPGKHPHMRGEDISPAFWAAKAAETPPHAWGRPAAYAASGASLRNTPTCVGKTGKLALPARRTWKHPHMRGEDPERSLNFFLHTWY